MTAPRSISDTVVRPCTFRIADVAELLKKQDIEGSRFLNYAAPSMSD